MNTHRLSIDEIVERLERTPAVVAALVAALPDTLAQATEGDGTWSPYDVVGHLVHGERTDWIPRARHIMRGDTAPFEPFDREAQLHQQQASLGELVDEFARCRADSITALRALGVTDADCDRPGLHPALGPVTLGELLATWLVHDLDHVVQISRILAKTQRDAVGPWSAYLSVLGDREPR